MSAFVFIENTTISLLTIGIVQILKYIIPDRIKDVTVRRIIVPLSVIIVSVIITVVLYSLTDPAASVLGIVPQGIVSGFTASGVYSLGKVAYSGASSTAKTE